MKKILGTAVMAATLAAAPAFADQLDDIKARGSLICGVLSVAKPFGFQDDQTRELVGYDIDFCKAVADKMGLKADPVAVSVEGRIPELKLGKIDILAAALGYTSERAEQVDYSEVYFISRQVVIVDEDAAADSLADLNGLKISTSKGSSSEQYLRNSVPGAEVLSYQDVPSSFLAFAQNKVDGMALTDLATMQFRDKSPTPFRLVSEPLKIEPWGLGIAKGEATLVAAVNTALDELEASGEAQAIFDKWFGPETAYGLERSFKIAPVDTYLSN